MTPELKPCPFCGGEAILCGQNYYYVFCKECDAETKGSVHRKEAIDGWNRRVGDDPMERMVDDGK